jgi:hypothetical protein
MTPRQSRCTLLRFCSKTPPASWISHQPDCNRATRSTSLSPTNPVSSSTVCCFILDLHSIFFAVRYHLGCPAPTPTSPMLLQFPEVQRTKMVTPLVNVSLFHRLLFCSPSFFAPECSSTRCRSFEHCASIRPRDVSHSFFNSTPVIPFQEFTLLPGRLIPPPNR